MKRGFDIIISLVLVLVLLPLLLVVALSIALTSPGGAFFRQVRVGRGGHEFKLMKFRTMRPDSEAKGQLTIGGRDPRVTRVGFFLRKSKLDELPQLWNVLVGEMSLVGPRPEVPKYVALYSAEQRQVLNVRPGITGPASLRYIDENELLARSSDPERTYIQELMPAKLAIDLRYVRERSFLLDLGILFGTARGMLFRG
ncbi:MAG: sugar transferase [Flavobacteriales bacterium]|nr:MAG: sugar transferase [Flavobacteriales bacterium]